LGVNKADFSFRLFAGFLSQGPDARSSLAGGDSDHDTYQAPRRPDSGCLRIVIVGVWFATEWCAAELGFQPQVGSPNSVNLRVFMRPDRLHPVKAGATRHRFAAYGLGRLSPARQRLPTQV
jgi:hypothetical protein